MKLLITSAASDLARTLATALSSEHQVRLTERRMVDSQLELAVSDLNHDAATNLLVRGRDVIIHVAEPLPDEAAPTYIDYVTRCTYNLLWAAHQEGVRRVIYLSTLDLMAAYGPEYIVTERWRPRPTPTHPLMGKHLGEYVCREFAREHKLEVVSLRLGKVVDANAVAGQPVDAMWLDQRDLVSALSQALSAPLPNWSVIHLQSSFPGARFPVEDAKRLLGYAPTIDFGLQPTPSH